MKAIFSKHKILVLSLVLAVGVLITGTTVAYLTDADTIKNILSVSVDNVTEIIEETGEYDEGYLQKRVKVQNNDEKCSTFIRARITVSPDLWDGGNGSISLVSGKWSGGSFSPAEAGELKQETGFTVNGWVYAADGYWYYTGVVPAATDDNDESAVTASLFDAVYSSDPGNVPDFDLTVTEDSVLSVYDGNYIESDSNEAWAALTNADKVKAIQDAFKALKK
ncbi:MAG: SipW-dependent-type signal peptide-containing protein [Eubacterium sp.]|nr:SipW-dependent-type signal peptide-containing protein [Eubacterium sp.]